MSSPQTNGRQTNVSFGSTQPGQFPTTPNLQANLSMSSSVSRSMVTMANTKVAAPEYVQHRAPFVITENDVRHILQTQHGFGVLHVDDVVVVTNMVYRMVTLCAEYEPPHQSIQFE
jgi:hypothetical protein